MYNTGIHQLLISSRESLTEYYTFMHRSTHSTSNMHYCNSANAVEKSFHSIFYAQAYTRVRVRVTLVKFCGWFLSNSKTAVYEYCTCFNALVILCTPIIIL